LLTIHKINSTRMFDFEYKARTAPNQEAVLSGDRQHPTSNRFHLCRFSTQNMIYGRLR
jgi:hypothetical protein